MFHTLSPSAGYPLTFSPITHACLKALAANWRGCPLKSKESRRKVMSFWPSGHLCVPPQTCSNACQPNAWIALLRNAAHLNFVVFNGCARVNLLKLRAETHQADWGIKACPPNRRCVVAAFALKTQNRADLQLSRRDSIDKYVCMCSHFLNKSARPLLCLCFYAFIISDSDLRSLVLQGDSSRWRRVPLRCRRAYRCYRWSRCYGNLCLLHPLPTREPGEAVAASHQRSHSPQQEPGQHRPAGLQRKTPVCPADPRLPFPVLIYCFNPSNGWI